MLRARNNLAAAGLTTRPVAAAVGIGPAVPDRRRRGRTRHGGTRRSGGTRTRVAGDQAPRPARPSREPAARPVPAVVPGAVLATAAMRSPPRPCRVRCATTSASPHPSGPPRPLVHRRSWKATPASAASLDDLRQHPVVAIDVNHGHLAVAVIAPDGNILRHPGHHRLGPGRAAGRHPRRAPARRYQRFDRHREGARRPGHRHRGSRLRRGPRRRTAKARAARPSRGRRGRRTSGAPSPASPPGKLRGRLVQMAANAGLSVIVIDPAYTSRWAAEHWLRPMRQHHPTGDRSPRGSAGDRATRARTPGQAPRDREPDRPGGGGAASPDAAQDHPGARDRTQETRRPTRPPGSRPAPRPDGLTGPRQATRQPKTVRGRQLHRTTSC